MNSHGIPVCYPDDQWSHWLPEEAWLSRVALEALSNLVMGRGCVVRDGRMVFTWGDPSIRADIASAFKPILSVYLFIAIQEGKLGSPDDRVAHFEPRLRTLNTGKDSGITWRHLASQTSGYGLSEAPGEAYSYNDYAMALYYDVLTQAVYNEHGTSILRSRLGSVLQFEDEPTHEAFGPGDRPGRLAMSVRDLARLGLLFLRKGKWKDRQLVDRELLRMAVSSPVPADLPSTREEEAEMLPGQRTIGGGKNIVPYGQGCYSFGWWLNVPSPAKDGRGLFHHLPPDTYVANGHGGKRMLWIVPSQDLVICWNDADIGRESGLDPKLEAAARLIQAMF